MRETIRHILHLGTMAAFVLSWSSCSEEDALPAADGELHPTITLVTSIGGMGDNAYLVYDCGIDSIMVTVNAPMSLDTALTHAEPLLADCADRLFRFIKIGMNLR